MSHPRSFAPSRRPLSLLSGAVALLLLAPAVLSAQQSTTRGFSVGAHLQGSGLAVEQDDASTGGGLGVRVGYGFNRIITGFIQVDGSVIDIEAGGAVVGQWALAHADIGARFHFANSLRRWVPYLEASVGARTVGIDDAQLDGELFERVTFSGGAFTFGGGISTYLKPSLALDVSLKLTSGQFTEFDVGNAAIRNLDIDARSTRFGVGLVWWP